MTEQVSVIAVPETIDTRTGEFRTTISARQLSELPTLTRNPYDLVALSGNVKEAISDEGALVGGEQGGRGTGFSINGQRTASTNILLDGGDNNYLFTAGIGQEIPLDAVQEFSVITNNFSAQYGRASGGIVNVVTKSGTNRFSGTGYEFFRNEKLASNSPDNEARRHRERQVQPQSARLQPWRPDREGQGPLLLEPRVHRHPQHGHADLLGRGARVHRARQPRPTKNYFAPTARVPTINGPILTRADVTAKLDIGAGAFNNLPANLPVFGRADVLIANGRGRRVPAGQLPDRSTRSTSRWHRARRPTSCYAFCSRSMRSSGTQSREPVSAVQHRAPASGNTTSTAIVTRVWSNNFTSQSKLVWNKLVRRPAGQRPGGAAADDEPDWRGRGSTANRSPSPATAVQPRQRHPGRRPAEADCSSIRIRPG